MKFVDYVTISVRSGKGGPGAVSFRREKYQPRGGPDGGDGGRGGSVLVRADAQLNTLLDLRYNRHHYAGDGKKGQGSHKSGKDGNDIVLRVPPGTLVKDTDTGVALGEVLRESDELVLAPGGRGGKGNSFFKSATRQTPRFSQPGEPGVERNVTLELRLLADVGLVGFPNAGKSTLVASLSSARPRVADYPFTTLVPSLGVVRVEEYKSFVIADIPGIIKGAHQGKGLGDRFLRHIERNALLLFMIPADSNDIGDQYNTLLHELKAFNPRILDKPRSVALSKMDLVGKDDRDEILRIARSELPADLSIYPISGVTHEGLEALRHGLWKGVQTYRSYTAQSDGPE